MEPDVAACNLLHLPKPENLPAAHFDTFVLLCCWHLWKRRNGIVLQVYNFCRIVNLMLERGAVASRGRIWELVTTGATLFL